LEDQKPKTKNQKPPVIGWLLLLLLVGRIGTARAQIVDDSTKVVYGPRTTRVVREAEVARDSVGGTRLDTVLTRLPQSRFWLHDSTFQQDLGVLGTASRPLLYQANLQLGARFGRTAFDRNTRDGRDVPYYDSRSPFSFFRLVQSSSGEQIFEISYSRSLKKNFSVGIDYERVASNLVLAAGASTPQVEHNNFTLFSRFQSEDGRYHLLTNYSASRQSTREQGGINFTAEQNSALRDPAAKAIFSYANERVFLTQARSLDDRDQLRVFQTYRLARRGFTAYHVLDVRRQLTSYLDEQIPRDAADNVLFYPRLGPNRQTFRNPLATSDRAFYRQVENTLGLLGRTDRVEYNLYARQRGASLGLQTTQLSQSGPGVPLVSVGPASVPDDPLGAPSATDIAAGALGFGQLFVGGTAAFNYREVYAVEVAGEYLPFDNSIKPKLPGTEAGTEYWLRGRVRTGPLSAEVLLNSYSATLTQRLFVGNHHQWRNFGLDEGEISKSLASSFKNTTSQQFTVRLAQRLPLFADHTLEASATIVNLSNLIYYNGQGQPTQVKDNPRLLIGFVRHRVRLGSVYFDNQATYTQGAGNDNPALRVPALVAESRVYYQRRVFGRALFAQVGGELYYQARFRPYGYAPDTQQFFVQDAFTSGSYAIFNAFVAADINTVSIFLKGAYLNQGIYRDGYFASPALSGYPRRFQLGLRWRFYN